MLTFIPVARRRPGWFTAAAFVAAVCVPSLLAGCSTHPLDQPAAAASSADPAARPVVVVGPSQGEIVRTITQPATLQGIEEAMLYAKAAGSLKANYVDKGDRVRAGQVPAVIESPELLDQQVQARSAYQQSLAAAQGALASRSRAQADVAQAGASPAEAAVEGARSRLRPILMTSAAMIAGMLPMALAPGEGGEQTAPLGRAVIGGLAATTLATLFVLPSVFAMVQGGRPVRSASLDPDDPESALYALPEAEVGKGHGP